MLDASFGGLMKRGNQFGLSTGMDGKSPLWISSFQVKRSIERKLMHPFLKFQAFIIGASLRSLQQLFKTTQRNLFTTPHSVSSGSLLPRVLPSVSIPKFITQMRLLRRTRRSTCFHPSLVLNMSVLLLLLWSILTGHSSLSLVRLRFVHCTLFSVISRNTIVQNHHSLQHIT